MQWGAHTRSLVHSLPPFFQLTLESVVDNGVKFVRVGLNQTKVKDAVGAWVVILSLLALGVPTPELALVVFDIFQGFLEIVLAALLVMVLLFDKFKRPQPEAALFICLPKQAYRLAFGA